MFGATAADSEAVAQRNEQTQRFAKSRAQSILHKIQLELAIRSRLSAWQEKNSENSSALGHLQQKVMSQL
jgi:hypothetical protein